MSRAYARLRPRVREGWVLSTCNRTELYAVLEPASRADTLLEFLVEWSGLPAEVVRAAVYVHEGVDVARHALRVAGGLESMVLGEDQIQSQVKGAIAAAREARMLGPTLEKLGAAALSCGKGVRTFTSLGRNSLSLEALAVRAAVDRLGSLAERSVVVLGAGQSATLVTRHLQKARAAHVTVISRSNERASAVAGPVGARVGSLAGFSEALGKADAVFACTSAPHPVLTPDFLVSRADSRPGAPLLCIDLGMPRDVDASVADIPGVTVVTLDDLAPVADAHRRARQAEVPAAESIVEGEVDLFMEWVDGRSSAAAITALHAHARAVAEAELAHALARLPFLDNREREVLAEMAHRIARKLTHAPIRELKRPAPLENAARG